MHYRLKNGAGEIQHATECFECAPKQSRTKTYPVCTIRNTPEKPIHCIVWAKELLFARLFGRYRTSPVGLRVYSIYHPWRSAKESVLRMRSYASALQNHKPLKLLHFFWLAE